MQRRILVQCAMGIRFKLLLAFVSSFVLIGAISLYALQLRLHAEFEALEQTEVKAALSRVMAVSEAMPASLMSVTNDWAAWSDMYAFASRPKQLKSWVDDNIGASTALNSDLSFFEVLGVKAQVTLAIQSGKDGAHFSLDEPVRRLLVQRHIGGAAPSGCMFVPIAERHGLVCAANITQSNGSGSFVGVLATARVFSDKRMADWQSKMGFPSRLIPINDVPSHVTWTQTGQVTADIGLGKLAKLTEADTQVLYLPLRGLSGQSDLSLELRVPRAIHAQSATLNRYVLAQTLVTSFVTALFLALVVHWVLVKRLRSFHQQLSGVAAGGGWNRRVSVGGRDEVGSLAAEVNGLLTVIETQVKELTIQSMTDPLTGLPNRRAFDLRLALEFSRSQREGQTPPLALLLMDVDFFKEYNDHYGHPQGDVALKAVSHVLNTVSARAIDLAARIGGEEFVLMLPATSQEGAEKMAHTIQQCLADQALPHAQSNVSRYLTVSIGVAMLGSGDESPSALLGRADRALYEAKTGGRNRFVVDRCPVPTTLQAQD